MPSRAAVLGAAGRRRRAVVAARGPAQIVATAGDDAWSGSAASLVVPTPPELVDGDRRYVALSISGQTVTTPSGWALDHVEVFASTRRVYLFSHVHAETDPTDYTFTFSGAANHGAVQMAVRGHNVSTPLHLTPVVASDATGGSVSLVGGSLTTSARDVLTVRFFASVNNQANNTLTTPAGMVAVDAQVGTGTTGHSVLLAAEAKTSAGPTGTRTSTSFNSAVWAVLSFGISAGNPSVEPPPVRAYFQAADWMWAPIPPDPVLDPNSAAIVALLSEGTHSTGIEHFATNLVHPGEVSESTPRYDITFLHATGVSPTHEDWGEDPFGARTMPIPDGTENGIPPGDFGYVDGHISVGDPTTNTVFSIWQATTQPGPPRTWGASWGGRCDLDGDGREDPTIGISTGAGISRYAAVVRESEIAAGRIDHALFFGSNMVTLRGGNPAVNFRYPATTSDGSNASGAATTIPEGARVQLDPSIDLTAISGITAAEIVIGTALQKYGAYCGDNATGANTRMAFIFEYVPGGSSVYTNAGLVEYGDLPNIPWSSMRVLRQWDGL